LTIGTWLFAVSADFWSIHKVTIGNTMPAGQKLRAKPKKPGTGNPAAHTRARYRCFLPDLAGLAGMRCVGPMPDIPNFIIRSRPPREQLRLVSRAQNRRGTSLAMTT